MTSYTGGNSCPPYSRGQDSPKKPPSYSALCHSPCRAQYSSPELGNSLACNESQDLSRSRKAASSGESRKSNVDLLQLDGPQLGRGQRAAQVHVRQALPGIADAAVYLNGGLAHRPRGPRAVDLCKPAGADRLGWVQLVDRPGGVPQDAHRALDQCQTFGEQVCDGLVRADRLAILLTDFRVITRQRVRTAGRADQVRRRGSRSEEHTSEL